jgi:hypothetical protein
MSAGQTFAAESLEQTINYLLEEDFIRLAASKSLLTGQPYVVRTRDGKEMHLDAWLTEALNAHRTKS